MRDFRIIDEYNSSREQIRIYILFESLKIVRPVVYWKQTNARHSKVPGLNCK
jgi:hypothetical protein